MVDLGVTSKRQVFVQQLGDSIAGARVSATILRDAVGALCQFVLDVMADQTAEFQIAFSSHLGKVVFPNEEVFVILPGRLVPQSRISICTTPVCWQTHTWCLREDSRKLGRDIAVKGLARLI